MIAARAGVLGGATELLNGAFRVGLVAHSSSVVEDGARLGEGAVIGPFCHVGAGVKIGAGAELVSHVVVTGDTSLGAGAKIFPFASVGTQSQDLKSRNDSGRLTIGANCIIREGVTINAGTHAGGGETRIGDDCAFLSNSHVGHDCRIGDGVVLSNGVLLGGHVQIGDHAMVGGGTAVHQHVRIGAHAFVGGLAGVEGDVPPYALAGGNRAHLFGLNLVGLRRRGFSDARIERLRDAFRLLFGAGEDAGQGVFAERIELASERFRGDEDVGLLLNFLQESSQRPLCAPRGRARG